MSENVRVKRGGYHDFPPKAKNVLFHSTESIRRGTLLCFTKNLVEKNFMDKLWGGGGGREGGSITIFFQ